MAIQEAYTFQSAVTTNGNGTAADVSGLPGVCVQVEGITTASVVFEGRIGTLTYTGIQAVNLNDGSVATLTIADGLWYVPTGGLEDVRARVSTYSGGTITVIGRAIYNPVGMTLADIDVAGAEAVTLSEAQWDDTDKLAVSLYAKTTAGGDTPLEMGQDTVTASLSVAPATDIADATYLGDIKFGEALPAGTALLGTVGIDQATAGTTNKVVAEIEPVAGAAADIHAPAASTAAVVTYAASAGVKHHITGMAWSYDGGIPVDGNLIIEDVSGTTVFTMDITEEGPGFIVFPNPKQSTLANTAMIITLADPGDGVTGKLSILNHWTE